MAEPIIRSQSRTATPTVIVGRDAKEAVVERQHEADGSTTDALAMFEAGMVPTTRQNLLREMVELQRQTLVELRILTYLLQENLSGWHDLDQLRQEFTEGLSL